MKTCDKLTALIMNYWYDCINKNGASDFKVNNLIESYAEKCGIYEKTYHYDVELTVRFLTNSQKRKLYKQLINSGIIEEE